MHHPIDQIEAFWPLALFVAAVILLAAAMIGSSHLLGEHHKGRTTGEPYESGLISSGPAWIRFDVKYYLVAMFF
ncbi:MAG: NADH-quinone oxidoreductase subunit A, partial [Smithellaceae bacterium]|nr:NADH-quinone oxidoreductase subunit A [Smithellaceae bacterium]